MDQNPDRPRVIRSAAAARRALAGLGVREFGIGAAAVAVLLTLGVVLRRGGDQKAQQLAVIRSELAMQADIAEVYRDRFSALQNQAAQIRRWAESQTNEPLRTWARERLRRYDALLAIVNHEAEAKAFAAARREIEHHCARGDPALARARLSALATPTFPSPSEFESLRQSRYEEPLAAFSRQNPEFYRAFRQFEAPAAKRDETALRGELAAESALGITPQLMLKADLLAAVAATDDPAVENWSTLASALDYFDAPNAETLGRWRRAQAATRKGDWTAAAAEMQAIAVSKVRTRQPFRAAYGRALLKARPDQPTEAYPFLAEAALAGDRQARTWVAQEDTRNGRFAQAQRWLEGDAAEGDAEATTRLLALYEQHPETAADLAHVADVLEHVAERPDASVAALLFLGRVYERADPSGSTGARAFACYAKAAAKGSPAAQVELARCALAGIGTPPNPDQARDAACRAFQAGAHEAAAPLLLELMQRTPERTAPAVLKIFEQEDVAGAGGYTESRVVDGPGVAQIKAALARYLDQVGNFGQAARLYAGSKDPTALRRHTQLTASHACETCGGRGKVQVPTSCLTCGGKGKQSCSYCGGTGFTYVPGAPPCTSCAGTGTIVQNRKVVACSTCGGSGKGKGSVIKQDCVHCDHGSIRCTDCIGGQIKMTKDCPDCHGRGSWSLAERAGGE